MTTTIEDLSAFAAREASAAPEPEETPIQRLCARIEGDLAALAVEVSRAVTQALGLPRPPVVRCARMGCGRLTATLWLRHADPSDPSPVTRHLDLVKHSTVEGIAKTLRGTLTEVQLSRLTGVWP